MSAPDMLSPVQTKLTAILDALVGVEQMRNLGVIGACSDVEQHAASTFQVIDRIGGDVEREIAALVEELRVLVAEKPTAKTKKAVRR